MFDKICLILVIIGALNWGLVGLFEFDLVAWAFGGATAIISRIIYTVIALAGIWCISLLFSLSTICLHISLENICLKCYICSMNYRETK